MKSRAFILFLWCGAFLLAGGLFNSCKKESPTNPYDAIIRPVDNDNPTADNLPVGSFAWLHGKIFRPTCANSGCHDGTFEPEFRTIAGAYNSLVNHPVIANDPQNSFQYRVVPGNSAASFLHTRLTTFVPNTSGVMPLSLDPNSDYPDNQAMYTQKIAEWINSGAPDMYGNPAPPADVNAPPVIYGVAVFPSGNTSNPYPREEGSPYGIGPILVPATTVDVWILPYDDNALFNQFNAINLKASTNLTGFTTVNANPFVLSDPIEALMIDDNPGQFYYKATLNLSAAQSGQLWFLRSYVDDGVQQNVTEIPNDASAYFWYLLFSLKIV